MGEFPEHQVVHADSSVFLFEKVQPQADVVEVLVGDVCLATEFSFHLELVETAQ